MAQELNVIEKQEDFQNPYKEETIIEVRGWVFSDSIVDFKN